MTLLLDLPKVHFGFGSRSALPAVLADLGISRPLIVTDQGVRGSGTIDLVLGAFGELAPPVFDGVTEPPTFAGVNAAITAYRSKGCDGFIAVGGGSVIDTAKMACILATHPGEAADYAGLADRIVKSIAPLVVLPTTSGSGSEVSPSTGIHPGPTVAALRTRHPALVPLVTICDPELTMSMPVRLTAAAGLDALTHCIEGYLASTSNAIVDAIALSGITHIVGSLERAVSDGDDRLARESMMMGSLQGGISISKGLGPAHAMATAFSHLPVPHGILAALSLAPSLDLMERNAPDRMSAVARAMLLPSDLGAAEGFRALLTRVCRAAGLPLTLGAVKDQIADIEPLAEMSLASPVNLTSPYYPTLPEYRSMIGMVLG